MDLVIENDNFSEHFEFFDNKIRVFNGVSWNVVKKPLVVTIRDEEDKIIGGGTSRIFGNGSTPYIPDNCYITKWPA